MTGAQLWIVLGIVLLLFGGSRLPKLARDLGRSQQEFKAGLEDGKKPVDGENDANGVESSAESTSSDSTTSRTDTSRTD